MNELLDQNWAIETTAVRAGQVRGPEGEHNEPVFTTSSFVFASAAEAAERFCNDAPGNVYSRFTNPSVALFERRLAAMEGARFCVATASGMAAILTLCLTQMKAGDHLVASRNLFGSTANLFTKILSRAGIRTSFVGLSDLDAWARAVDGDTVLAFLETPSNPLTELADIAAVADIVRASGARLVVDNCMCTPVLQRPLALGADIVVHSATKYIDGQGRCVGGAVVTDDESVYDALFGFMRTAGPSLSPFNAWVFAKGLETLALRMRAHSDAALEIARWLESQPGVTRVIYPGLESHPQHELATRQQSGFGGIVAFEVAGGRERAWRVVDAARTISITANFGDAKSTITHPATTTHGRLTEVERREAGVTEDLLRLSVGLENVEDIMADLSAGLASGAAPSGRVAAA